jgi:RNA polymerase II subunit A small phosphatase-like protein
MLLNVLLDLDETLISSVRNVIPGATPGYTFQDKSWTVYTRHRLQEFLTALFARYNVSIFTASGSSYCAEIIENIILKDHPERKIDYIFHAYHCEQSKTKYNVDKKIKMLWEDYNIPYMNTSNTFLIDDRLDLYEDQPENVINILPFSADGSRGGQGGLTDIDGELERVLGVLDNIQMKYFFNAI